jgi:hypothetical protein
MIRASHGIVQQKSGGSYGTLTTAWIVATGESDTTIIGALNTLETDLTTYGLIGKMKALYPMVGGTAIKHKFNFMDARDLDVAFRLTFNGGWVHSSTGGLPNGTNAYANTFLIPIASLSLNNNHLSFYSRTQNNLINGVDMGAADAGNINMLDIEISFNNLRYYENSQNIYSNGVSGLLTNGMFVNSRIVNTDFKGYRNGYSEGTMSYVSASLTSYPIFLGARNDASVASFFSGKECSFATIGEGLSDTEVTNLYTSIQAFQTTLTRNV